MDTQRTFSVSQERFISIHRARKNVSKKSLIAPQSPGLEGLTDLHLHCSEPFQNDALSIMKFASQSGMKGVMLKTYKQLQNPYTARDCKLLREQLDDWCASEGITPVIIKSAYIFCHNPKEPDLEIVEDNLKEGTQGIWLPMANALRSYMAVGPQPDSIPLTREEGLAKGGLYLLDDDGELLPQYKQCIDLVAQYDRALFFGHRFHEEMLAVAKYGKKCGLTRMVIDHPFSPFCDVTWALIRELVECNVKFNFTYNEISPVGGVDPQDIADTIQEFGSEHFTLSSDTGDYVFPNSIESLRCLHETLRCYGISDEQIQTMAGKNGSFILGID